MLEHWQYDVFRVRWADQFVGTTDVAFALAPTGGVSANALSRRR